MQHIFDNLKLSNTKNLHNYIKNINIESLPLRTNKSLHGMEYSPHSIFILNNKPLILFFEQAVEAEKVFQQCWNFSESPIIIIENEIDFDIYNGYEYILENGNFLLQTLNKNELNYISIMSGKYIEKTKFLNKDNRIDNILLKNIKDAREELIYDLLTPSIQEKRGYDKKIKLFIYKELSEEETKELKERKNIANALIGRIIFIRYLIDRGVSIGFRKENEQLSNDKLVKILGDHTETYKLFKYLKSEKGFNGDWFPIITSEEIIVKDIHLRILQNLINGYNFEKKQGTLFNFYDFSIIPIEFISNVYESFIGEDEQSKNGAYYTPTFLVDYILKYSVDEFFKNNPDEYNCKVLDPACGSGIFLVETLRKLINQFEKIKKRDIEPNEIVALVKHNIYAIDKDRNAILISVFSLYLTMLDYQNPKDIEKFLFPYLIEGNKNPDPNFFNNDFFDSDAPFNKILSQKKVNFIIGNPPYKRGGGNSELIENYINHRENDEQKKIGYSNKEVAQAFMIRCSDISKEAKVSFIVNSKIFYNIQSNNFREYFLSNYNINHILELSSVRHEVFPTANTPVLVIFYQYNKKLNNTIKYISIKPSPYFDKLKMLFITKNDFKKVSQDKLIKNDFLWKVLIYGSYLDFNFIKRLKSYEKIEDNISFKAQGIILGGGDQNPTDQYIGMPYVKTSHFKPFYLEENNLEWSSEFAHRNKSMNIFKAPSLLVSKGISKDLELKAAILKKNSIFADSITAIKCETEETLYNIMGILHSSLFKYLTMNTASSIGTEREQIHNPEKFGIPYISNDNITNASKKLEQLHEINLLADDNTFNLTKSKLNEHVIKAFNLNEEECALVDFATNITIPWIMQKKYDVAFKKINYKDKLIEDYVSIFINHYTKIYEEQNMYFKAKILYNNYAIGVYFKVLDTNPKELISWKKEKNIDNFIKLSGKKTLENLFIQKDIKGFEPDGFYVVKPNEYKNWHKAIGYLDFYEFDDAILRTGKEQWKN